MPRSQILLLIILTFVLSALFNFALNTSSTSLADVSASNAVNKVLPFAEDDEEDEDEDEDEEGREHEEEEFEEHHRHLEMERVELEATFGRMEVVARVAEIAKDEVATASFALMHFAEVFEGPEDAIEFLEEAYADADDDAIKRLLRIKMAELYMEMDEPEKVRDQMKKLVTGK